MKCARCNAALDDDATLCMQCGAVVGMTYQPKGDGTAFATPKPSAAAFSAPGTHARRSLSQRVKSILRSPRQEWTVIATEHGNRASIYTRYVMPLALIGPLALTVRLVYVGTPLPILGVVKVALGAGIAAALLMFMFALLQVFVLTWAVNAMAPWFRIEPEHGAALNVVAYSLTPIWLGGLLFLLPALAFLWVVAAVYAMVLAYLGLQVLMRCTPQQALGYAVASFGAAFVVWMVAGALVTAIMGFGPVMLE